MSISITCDGEAARLLQMSSLGSNNISSLYNHDTFGQAAKHPSSIYHLVHIIELKGKEARSIDYSNYHL